MLTLSDEKQEVFQKEEIEIGIKKLCVMASIGIHEYEREEKQSLIISLRVKPKFKVESIERIDETISYSLLKKVIFETIEQKHYDLIETLAETIIGAISQKVDLSFIEVTVEKPRAIEEALSAYCTLSKTL